MMTTFLSVHYTATMRSGEEIDDILPLEEIPDRPPNRYKYLRPFYYKKIMEERQQAIHRSMDRLLDLCMQNGYSKISASIEWEEL
jgi:hypothetical protein